MDCFKLHSLELSGDELEVDGTDSGPEDEFCADLSRQPTSARYEVFFTSRQYGSLL